MTIQTKHSMKGLIRIFTELIILFAAIIIFPMVALGGVIYSLVKHIIKFDYKIEKQLKPILRSLSLALDGFANACAGELINDTLTIPKQSIVRYGSWHETISAISGLMTIYTKDTWLRRLIDKVLFFDKEHCHKAITDQQHIYYESISNINLTKN